MYPRRLGTSNQRCSVSVFMLSPKPPEKITAVNPKFESIKSKAFATLSPLFIAELSRESFESKEVAGTGHFCLQSIIFHVQQVEICLNNHLVFLVILCSAK